MYEYEISFVFSGETAIICGYSFVDACARAGIDPNEVEVLNQEYVD